MFDMKMIAVVWLLLVCAALAFACAPTPGISSQEDWDREFGHAPQRTAAALARWRRRVALASIPEDQLPPLAGAACMPVPAHAGDLCFAPESVAVELAARTRGCCGAREFAHSTHVCCAGGMDHAEEHAAVLPRGACLSCPLAREPFALAAFGGPAHAACCGDRAFDNRTHACFNSRGHVIALADYAPGQVPPPTPQPTCYFRSEWNRAAPLAALVWNRAEFTADDRVLIHLKEKS